MEQRTPHGSWGKAWSCVGYLEILETKNGITQERKSSSILSKSGEIYFKNSNDDNARSSLWMELQ